MVDDEGDSVEAVSDMEASDGVELDCSDDDSAEEDSDSGVGEGDSDPDEDSVDIDEVSTGIEDDAPDDPPLDIADVELSHPPQMVSPGIQIVDTVVVTSALVSNLVLRLGVAVDKTGLIVQETQSDGKPDGTCTCLFSISSFRIEVDRSWCRSFVLVSKTKSSFVSSEDELEVDSLFVRLEISNAPLEGVGRMERQVVRREVEIWGLGVMIDV